MYTINCRGKLLALDQPLVMGIINTTPDSFYAASRVVDDSKLLQHAKSMLEAGAAILDIGGQSTRPGADILTAGEELERVLPAIASIHKNFPKAILSIDTYHASVAKAAVAAGVSIVNDISGGLFDEAMLPTVAAAGASFICMHNKGNAESMHAAPAYDNIAREVFDFFVERIEACRKAGIRDVIIDPGFGFAKNINHNLQLLRKLPLLSILGRPMLAGLSRKSTIYKTLNTTAEDALNGTTVLNTIALQRGADILRVHDVKEAVEVAKLFTAYKLA